MKAVGAEGHDDDDDGDGKDGDDDDASMARIMMMVMMPQSITLLTYESCRSRAARGHWLGMLY